MEELLIALMIGIWPVLLLVDGCTDHNEKMECIKQRGEWAKGACKFPAPHAEAAARDQQEAA